MSKKKTSSIEAAVKTNSYEEQLAQMRASITAHNQTLIMPEPVLGRIQAICDAFPEFREKCIFLFNISKLDDVLPIFGESKTSPTPECFACIQYVWCNGFRTAVSFNALTSQEKELLIPFVAPYITENSWID